MAWAALTVVGLAGLLYSERAGLAGRFMAKPMASAGFVALALAVGAVDSGFGRWMLVALVLSALGDVALLGKSEQAFLVGLGGFLIAHVAYSVAFSVRGVEPLGLVAAVPLGLFAWAVLGWLGPHLSGRMRPPVAAYAVAISLMGVVAFATSLDSWDYRIPAGAALFIVSDLAVARENFVTPGFINRLWGLPLYYGGQLLLAWAAGG